MEKQAELVKQTLNAVASLVSLPIQNNWDFGIGPEDAMKFTANIQPVMPVSLSQDWNRIVRTILPVIYQESRFPGDGSQAGLGDTQQSFFFAPMALAVGRILGVGPALLYPTAPDNDLGESDCGAGPTIVAWRQERGFTYGILTNHIWSSAGWGSDGVNATHLQPFFGSSTKTYTTFLVNTESTYDWEQDQWSVSLNFMSTQLLKVGKQSVSLPLGSRYDAEVPSGGPEWGLRFAGTLFAI